MNSLRKEAKLELQIKNFNAIYASFLRTANQIGSENYTSSELSTNHEDPENGNSPHSRLRLKYPIKFDCSSNVAIGFIRASDSKFANLHLFPLISISSSSVP